MLRTSNISLQFAQLKTSRIARFSLESLMMEDRTPRPYAVSHSLRLLDSRPPPSVLTARSTPLDVTDNAESEQPLSQKLVHLEYRSQPGKPDEVRFTFSRLHVEWNPETIQALLAFVRLPASIGKPAPYKMQTALEVADSRLMGSASVAHGGASSKAGDYFDAALNESVYLDASPVARQIADHSEEADYRKQQQSQQKTSTEIRVVAQLQSLSMSLNAERNGERLALLAMRDLGANVTMPAGGGMVISGQLGNLTAQDTMTNPNTPYEMIGLRTSEESSLLTFEYVSPNDEERARMRNEGAYDSSLKLRMSSVQVNFWQAAVMRTWNYLQSGVLGTLTSATANAMAKRAAAILDVEVSATSIDIEVESPLVLLPTSAGGSVGLRADLGRMGVKNTLVRKMEEMEGTIVDGEGSKEINLDEIHVTLEQMKVDSVDFASVAAAFDGIGVQMLQDVKMDVLVERGVGNTVGRALTVTGRGGELACDCSKMQYELFIRVFMQNLARRGDPLRDRSLSAPATPQKRLNRSSHLSPSTSIAASPSAAAAADGAGSAAIPPVEMRISFIYPC